MEFQIIPSHETKRVVYSRWQPFARLRGWPRKLKAAILAGILASLVSGCAEATPTLVAMPQGMVQTLLAPPTATCTGQPGSPPTATPRPAPTDTAKPSPTPVPTETQAPAQVRSQIRSPTETAVPTATNTPLPSPTPIPPTPAPLRVVAQVVRVIDGNTIEVSIDERRYELCYLGIDYPETAHPQDGDERRGTKAREANRKLVEGKTVYLEADKLKADEDGRLLRYVWAGATMVNAELVRLGYAQAADWPPDVKYRNLFIMLENQARESGRGLWGEPPTPTLEPTAEPAEEPTATLTVPTVQPTETLQSPPTSTPLPTAQPTATATPSALVQPTTPPIITPTPSPIVEPTALATSVDVKIKYIYYDGQKGRNEPDEYCEIVNQGNAPVNLKGWYLNAGARGQDFIFPDFVLQPEQTCRVYTNEHHPESGGLSFERGGALWKNSGDCGILYDAEGNEVSAYCY